MGKINFITDLDRTIVHSKNKGFKCVEHIGEREITYMTEKSYNKLQNMLKEKVIEFIPCTMRNIDQTLRINFIKEYNPKLIICTNGAQIYRDGILDHEWDLKMKSLVKKEEVEDSIELIKSLNIKNIEIRNIEDFYITVKCETAIDAKEGASILIKHFKSPYKVMQIGVKIFIIHEKIDKIHAVDYIIEKFDINNVFTAGDSEVDIEFTRRGICILPKHSIFKHDDAIITEKDGIYSTEDILDILESNM